MTSLVPGDHSHHTKGPLHCCSPGPSSSHKHPGRDTRGLHWAQRRWPVQISIRPVGSMHLALLTGAEGAPLHQAHRKCHRYPFAESSQAQEADTELTSTSPGENKPSPSGQALGLTFLLALLQTSTPGSGGTPLSEKGGSCFKQKSTVNEHLLTKCYQEDFQRGISRALESRRGVFGQEYTGSSISPAGWGPSACSTSPWAALPQGSQLPQAGLPAHAIPSSYPTSSISISTPSSTKPSQIPRRQQPCQQSQQPDSHEAMLGRSITDHLPPWLGAPSGQGWVWLRTKIQGPQAPRPKPQYPSSQGQLSSGKEELSWEEGNPPGALNPSDWKKGQR